MCQGDSGEHLETFDPKNRRCVWGIMKDWLVELRNRMCASVRVQTLSVCTWELGFLLARLTLCGCIDSGVEFCLAFWCFIYLLSRFPNSQLKMFGKSLWSSSRFCKTGENQIKAENLTFEDVLVWQDSEQGKQKPKVWKNCVNVEQEVEWLRMRKTWFGWQYFSDWLFLLSVLLWYSSVWFTAQEKTFLHC